MFVVECSICRWRPFFRCNKCENIIFFVSSIRLTYFLVNEHTQCRQKTSDPIFCVTEKMERNSLKRFSRIIKFIIRVEDGFTSLSLNFEVSTERLSYSYRYNFSINFEVYYFSMQAKPQKAISQGELKQIFYQNVRTLNFLAIFFSIA